jgi:hypothetical protein
VYTGILSNKTEAIFHTVSVCAFFDAGFQVNLRGSFNVFVSKTFVHLRQVFFLQLFRLYKDIDLVMHMHVKRLQWVGHVVRLFSNRIPKQIMEGSCEGRKLLGKLRNRWEDRSWKDATKLLNIKNWRTAARNRSD